MLELLQQRDFPNGSARDAFVLFESVERRRQRQYATQRKQHTALQTSASSRIFFSATICRTTIHCHATGSASHPWCVLTSPVPRSLDLYTTPYVPSPTFSSLRYLSIQCHRAVSDDQTGVSPHPQVERVSTAPEAGSGQRRVADSRFERTEGRNLSGSRLCDGDLTLWIFGAQSTIPANISLRSTLVIDAKSFCSAVAL